MYFLYKPTNGSKDQQAVVTSHWTEKAERDSDYVYMDISNLFTSFWIRQYYD